MAGGCSFLPIKVFEVQQHIEGWLIFDHHVRLSSISKNSEPSYLSIVETEENEQNEGFWVQLANVRSCRSTCLKSNNMLKGWPIFDHHVRLSSISKNDEPSYLSIVKTE